MMFASSFPFCDVAAFLVVELPVLDELSMDSQPSGLDPARLTAALSVHEVEPERLARLLWAPLDDPLEAECAERGRAGLPWRPPVERRRRAVPEPAVQGEPVAADHVYQHQTTYEVTIPDQSRPCRKNNTGAVPSAARQEGQAFHDGITFAHRQVTQFTSTLL